MLVYAREKNYIMMREDEEHEEEDEEEQEDAKKPPSKQYKGLATGIRYWLLLRSQ